LLVNSYTFKEIGNILATDNIEIFKLICRNLDFKSIHNQLYTYLPLKILTYVFDQYLDSNKTDMILPPECIYINIDCLRHVNFDDIYILFNKYFHTLPTLAYKSISNRYYNSRILYLTFIMYYEYRKMILNNKKYLENFINFISKFTLQDDYLDMIILKIVVDNTVEKINDNWIDNYIQKRIILKNPVCSSHPRIYNEMIKFNVSDLSFVK
jgi:hypothetical protein